MRFALHVEGPMDRFAVPRLIEIIRGEPATYEFPQRRTGGHRAVIDALPEALAFARRAECDALVVHVDSDATLPHDAHDPASRGNCRRCEVEEAIRRHLSRRPDHRLKSCPAVPVQCMEAWILGFAARVNIRPSGPTQLLDRRQAKQLLYETQTPTRRDAEVRIARALGDATQAHADRVALAQPSFRTFVDEIRALRPRKPL